MMWRYYTQDERHGQASVGAQKTASEHNPVRMEEKQQHTAGALYYNTKMKIWPQKEGDY